MFVLFDLGFSQDQMDACPEILQAGPKDTANYSVEDK